MRCKFGGAPHWCVRGFFVVVVVGEWSGGCCGICQNLQNGRYRENKVDIMKKRLINSNFG
jgi:hypothetical protein